MSAGGHLTTLRFQDSLRHHLAALLWNDRVGRRQKVRSGDANDVRDDTFTVGGNYSPPVLVLPSGTLSPPAWSRCSQSGIPCWNGAADEAGWPTRAGSNSPRQPSLSSYLSAVTLLSGPKFSRRHCGERQEHQVSCLLLVTNADRMGIW